MDDTTGIDLYSPQLYAAGTYLHANSALAYCTRLEGDDDHLATVRPPSMLSSGEKVLWEAMGCLIHGHTEAALSLAEDGSLDPGNRDALREAVRRYVDARERVA